MFGYVSFINNPDNFLYGYHAWSQTLISILLIYFAYISADSLAKKAGRYIPTVILRSAAGLD